MRRTWRKTLLVGAAAALALAGCASNNILQVKAGACMNSQDIPTGEASNVKLVSCSAEHDMEAYASTKLPGNTFPGHTEIKKQAEAFCFKQFEPFIGKSYESSDLRIHYWSPSATTWDRSKDREVLCVVQAPAKVKGSLKGSAR